jgi:amidase
LERRLKEALVLTRFAPTTNARAEITSFHLPAEPRLPHLKLRLRPTEEHNIVDRPDPDALTEWARELNVELRPEDMTPLIDAVEGRLVAYDTVDRLAEVAPTSDFSASIEREPSDEERRAGWVSRLQLEGTPGGPLAGRTLAVKQTIAVAGTRTDPGNARFNHVASQHASVVARALRAGATIIGKAAATDFEHDGAGITGPAAVVDNPAAPGYLPAGSSAGAGALVAAARVDLAIGGDAGGSIREPASWNGCVGLKPTHGLVPADGTFPFEDSLMDLGPMAQDVASCALLLSVLADGRRQYDVDHGERPYTLGLLHEGFEIDGESDPEVDAHVRAALDDIGMSSVPVSVPLHEHAVAVWTVIAVEGMTRALVEDGRFRLPAPGTRHSYLGAFAAALDDRSGLLPITSFATLAAGLHVSRGPGARRGTLARELATALRFEYDAALEKCDVLVMPTTPRRAGERPKQPVSSGDVLALASGSFVNAAPFNVTGHPAISVPLGTTGGLPVGLQLVGRHHEDELVLRVARAIEARR